MSAGIPLSLIVPVYNVARFLPRFLESLGAVAPSTAEIIVVDDGSTDECGRLLAEFAARHSHVRVVRQPNGGLSAARNTGLALAQGTYVAFADSDDWFDAGYYERLVNLCAEHGLDMAVGNAMYHFEGRRADCPIFDDAPATGVVRGCRVSPRPAAQPDIPAHGLDACLPAQPDRVARHAFCRAIHP
jgi:glycosyltransferase involved in cell wall biosynthesis